MPANKMVKSYKIKLFTWKSESCSWCLVVERRERVNRSMAELNLSSTQSSSGLSTSPLEISTLPVLANIREDKKKRHTWILPRWGSRNQDYLHFLWSQKQNLLSLESAYDVGEWFENSLSCFCLSLGQLPQNLGTWERQIKDQTNLLRDILLTIFMNVKVFPLLHRLQFRANHIVPSRYTLWRM